MPPTGSPFLITIVSALVFFGAVAVVVVAVASVVAVVVVVVVVVSSLGFSSRKPITSTTAAASRIGSVFFESMILRLTERGNVCGEGDDRNRTGVRGFAGRCVATPPRRQSVRSVAPAKGGAECPCPRRADTLSLLPRAISSAGRAPPRQGGGHWFEPSIAHS